MHIDWGKTVAVAGALLGPFYKDWGKILILRVIDYWKNKGAKDMELSLATIKDNLGTITTAVTELVKVEGAAASGAPMEAVIAEAVSTLGATLSSHHPDNKLFKVMKNQPAVLATIVAGEKAFEAEQLISKAAEE